eukprot:scaffold168885_cov24-Tisochrysis_lutea.AAC.1
MVVVTADKGIGGVFLRFRVKSMDLIFQRFRDHSNEGSGEIFFQPSLDEVRRWGCVCWTGVPPLVLAHQAGRGLVVGAGCGDMLLLWQVDGTVRGYHARGFDTGRILDQFANVTSPGTLVGCVLCN